MKKELILMDDAGSVEMLKMSAQQLRSTPTLCSSYHNMNLEMFHRIINSFSYSIITIIITSNADLDYIELLLTKIDKLNVQFSEKDVRLYADMLIKLYPEKSARIRKSITMGRDILPIIKGE